MNIPCLFLEKEGDKPKNWQSNTILVRDGKGNIISQEVADDDEKEE